MSGNSSIHAVDRTSTLTNGKNKWTPVQSEGGALLSLPVGPSGALGVACLVAKTTAPGANDVLSSTTGFKGFEAVLAGDVTAGTGEAFTEMVAVAWSSTAADSAGVAAILASAVTEFDAGPSAPPLVLSNCRILRTINDIVSVLWDGTTTIKTIGVRAVGATPAQVDVVINVIS